MTYDEAETNRENALPFQSRSQSGAPNVRLRTWAVCKVAEPTGWKEREGKKGGHAHMTSCIFLPAASRSIRGYVCSFVRPSVRYSFKKRGVPIWGISRTFANDQEECQLEGLSRTFAIFICLNIIIVIDWRYLKALLFFVKTSFSPSGWRCTLDWLKRGRVGTASFMVK